MKQQEKTDLRNQTTCASCAQLKEENRQLRKQLEEMENRAHHDVLTGLPNRRFFIEGLEQRILRCQRYGDTSALLFLDVDNLKSINDEYGHGAGDALLRCLGQILEGNIRASDMVARIGGDEFAMLLDNLDADQIESKIEFLIGRIEQTRVQHEGQAIKLGASVGYCFIGPKDSVRELMLRADQAMYQAKSKA